MAFVVAWKSDDKEITYRDQNGKTFIKRRGSRAWRNNNPGNIIDSPFADSHGAIGDDTRMAIFPDESVGRAAIISLLTGAKYKNLSIRDAMYRYAPPSDDNDTEAYIAAIVKAVGVPAKTVIADLSDAELDLFANAIKKHEGWTVGEAIGDGVAAAPDAPAPTGLDPRVQKLIEIGTDTKRCEELRYAGRKAMVAIYGQITAKNACAATLWVFLQEAGFPLKKIEYGAGNLAKYIEKTLKWRRVQVGQQQPGDVAVCRDDDPDPPGADHIFFLTKRVNADEMMIVDNQESFAPHTRFASGYGGKTPVEYFLTLRSERASDTRMSLKVDLADGDLEVDSTVVTEDQDTNDLVVRFTPDGRSLE
ncbi:hypothetical protein LJR009_000319 [Bosea sp. LjRoot9]|uniref:hypothetical protein n=1 Tax=Bosea sp. LjRoot9 TaxID=3342341 RepID=UPI003ECF1BAD